MKKIFFVPASGAEAAEHYRDTILNRRPLSELLPSISSADAKDLSRIFKAEPMAVWGALPGRSSLRLWRSMEAGDYILFYQSGRFVCIGEIAHKLISKELANKLWGAHRNGLTWENIYFIINERHIKVDLKSFNELFGFKHNFLPQGFQQIRKSRQEIFERHYGDVYDVMVRLDRGEQIREKPAALAGYKLLSDEASIFNDAPAAERGQTAHTEIQWRLLQMGIVSKNEVWIARNDRSKEFDGQSLSDGALNSLPNLGLDPDTTRTVELIDTIWLRGRRVASAFEVEHSTSIYSGILRLSDLKAQAPNLTFPLYIVAPDERRDEVMRQLGRPTFSTLSVASSTKFLPYSKVRQLDDQYVSKNLPVTSEVLSAASEGVRPGGDCPP